MAEAAAVADGAAGGGSAGAVALASGVFASGASRDGVAEGFASVNSISTNGQTAPGPELGPYGRVLLCLGSSLMLGGARMPSQGPCGGP